MDKKWRPAQRDGAKSYKKGWGRPSGPRFRPAGPVDYSNTSGEDLAEYVLTVLARDPNAIEIKRDSQQQAHVIVSATCDPALTGRLIGKGGKTISALRLLVRAVANEHGKRVDVEVASQSEEQSDQ
jgi:predicted RNA-binding protein YlqC (UPF0109 family)